MARGGIRVGRGVGDGGMRRGRGRVAGARGGIARRQGVTSCRVRAEQAWHRRLYATIVTCDSVAYHSRASPSAVLRVGFCWPHVMHPREEHCGSPSAVRDPHTGR